MSEKEKLKYFLTVAKLGGVKQASDILGITPAHLFRKIHSLESDYSTKLFTRNYRGLDLTEDGRKFFKLAKKVIDEIEIFEQSISKTNHLETSKSIIVGSSYGISTYWISPAIPDFIKRNPEISITIKVSLSEFDLEALDLCISTKIPDRPDLIQKKIRKYTFKLYANKTYLEQFGYPKSPKDLNSHRLIFLAGDDYILLHEPESLFQIDNEGKFRKPKIVVNSAAAEMLLVKKGAGIACLSNDWEDLNDPNIVDIFPEQEKIVDIYATYNPNNKNSLIEPFIEHLSRNL